MCGIAGVFSLTPDRGVEPSILEAMSDTLRHRGPDDSGCLIDNGLGFGFRRLSIIDLADGNQPHANEDGRVHSICNGEIYNYKELRRWLEERGHRFRSKCDVEILPHLYEEQGAEFIERLNGQFAFAIYDNARRELILARDQVGIAPLFYTVADGWLIFASEIKAILTHPAAPREVDLTGLDQILTFPGPASPRTLFKGIHSLPPGHYLRVRDGQIETREYWDLIYPERGEIDAALSESEAIERLNAALRQAVDYRLQADVPVGFYLSGGLDSSLTAALIHQARPDVRRHSFSITFPQTEIDERRYQRLMSERVGSIHHETEFHSDDILDRLRAVVKYAERPLKESYDACTLALSRLVRETGLKVVVTGEGADELFAGYVGYRLDETRNGMEYDPFDAEAMLERELRERLWGDPDFFYERDYNEFRETKAALYSEALANRLSEFDCLNHSPVNRERLRNRHPIHQRSYLDFKLRIADHLCANHGDRVAYANSVEARYPFLDREVIDAARRIPPELLVKNGQEKYILRKMSETYVPSEILAREKFAFVAPGSPYILSRNIDWVNDLLSPDAIRRQGYFNPDTVERLKAMYAARGNVNTTFETDLLMIVLTFNLFLETYEMPTCAG